MEKIGNCGKCKYPIYDNVSHYERWGKVYHMLCGGRIPGAQRVPPKQEKR